MLFILVYVRNLILTNTRALHHSVNNKQKNRMTSLDFVNLSKSKLKEKKKRFTKQKYL